MSPNDYVPTILLDLDGTLVDSVYQHVVAWSEAFQARGYDVAQWRTHMAIGMGGTRLVPWLLGRHVDDAEEISDDHRRRFLDRAEQLRATAGARALLDDLERREMSYLVATSAEAAVRAALLSALGREDLPTADADDVGSSKPAPDLLLTACEKLQADPTHATLVGDSPWDAEAARRVGMRTIAVRCGGFDDARLLAAGADAVVDDPGSLVGRL